MAKSREYPRTPDGRYFVVGGTLWRCSNPELAAAERESLVKQLMAARRAVAAALRAKDAVALKAARAAVDNAKRGLGERGEPWWTDGSPDYNRRKVTNTRTRRGSHRELLLRDDLCSAASSLELR